MTNISERRDREVARSAGRKLPSPFTAKVVGVSFVPGYPGNLHRLNELTNRPPHPGPFPSGLRGDMAIMEADNAWFAADEAWQEGRARELPSVVLKRNPDNQYDSNAVEVHVPALGEHGMIGHMERPLAARLAPDMDSGGRWVAGIEAVLVDPDHEDRPGISITCTREDT